MTPWASPVMLGTVVALAGVFGLLIGSFLNVVAWRLPRRRSLVHPRSSCPRCGHPIRARHNIPVLSWLALRGRCHDCRAPISWRYPAVELVTGAAFAGVTWWMLGATARPGTATVAGTVLVLVALLHLAAVSVVLTLIDLDTHTLPNRIIGPAYAVGAVLLTAAALFDGDTGPLLLAAIGAAALFAFYLVIALLYPGGMGFGDVKLAGLLGLYLAWFGWPQLVVGAFAAFLLGGVFSIGLLAMRRAGRKTQLPFGPWMLVGAWVGILFGGIISDRYLALFVVG